ncbi:MAG: hypothetical protein GY869_01870 [Planctomycetes bacterium]|nr:hypothetical protein [Planctomycetota bacterium]
MERLAPTRKIGDRRGEGITLGNIGQTYLALDKPEMDLDYCSKALAIAGA